MIVNDATHSTEKNTGSYSCGTFEKADELWQARGIFSKAWHVVQCLLRLRWSHETPYLPNAKHIVTALESLDAAKLKCPPHHQVGLWALAV
jgi:hypothetical protein